MIGEVGGVIVEVVIVVNLLLCFSLDEGGRSTRTEDGEKEEMNWGENQRLPTIFYFRGFVRQ